MDILGISCYFHDSAAALIRDGFLVAAAEEERFSRVKHDSSFPIRSINFCLNRGSIQGPELDYVVYYEKPWKKLQRILYTTVRWFPNTLGTLRHFSNLWLTKKLWIKNQISVELGIPKNRVLFVEHHLSHAASALFSSPFRTASILTVDGVGEFTTTSMGVGDGDWNGVTSNIKLNNEIRFPHSLGLLYSTFTSFLGFEVNEGEYKMMGLAKYGQPKFVNDVYKLINVQNDGSFQLNMDYFSFPYSTRYMFNERFIKLFGNPRPFGADFPVDQIFSPQKKSQFQHCAEQRSFEKYADIAASIQYVTEQILLKMADNVCQRNGSYNLCVAGGVALNSSSNGRIATELPLTGLYIQPAAGDAGGALGAALYTYHVLLARPRKQIIEHVYWGEDYSDAQIESSFREAGLSYHYINLEDRVADFVADQLIHGKVVGWFQGRFEWGPRALGNRSILADPRKVEMKELVNRKIKFREPFRPFAPSVLSEFASEYFMYPNSEVLNPARFMLLVLQILDKKLDSIAAVNHLGSARPQTVQNEISPLYHNLISNFYQATGIPMLLNTSFNVRGEPIVASPGDAIRTYLKTDLDILVLGQYVTTKKYN